MKTVVIAGGVGGAKFLRGLRELSTREATQQGVSEITAIVNVADDMWIAGLRVTPDLDSVMYALAGENDEVRGWGRTEESHRVSSELEAYGLGHEWFTLGDLDFGTHIARTQWLREGVPLSSVTQRLCSRWEIGLAIVPSSDDEVQTRVHCADGADLHFQEWWVRHRAQLGVSHFEFRGAAAAQPNPTAIEAIMGANRVIIAPSNPVVSVGAVLAIPGYLEALAATSARVVGVSPIIGGSVVRGMADVCLGAVGVETDALSVGLHYGSRSNGGLLDAWLVDTVDERAVGVLERAGITAAAVPLWMSTVDLSCGLAEQAMRI